VKVAVTADVHLTSHDAHPERFQVMESILHLCREINVDMLVIAGDLFDQSGSNYTVFESLYKDHRHPALQTHVIPGNHDLNLEDAAFALEGFTVYTKPHLLRKESLSLLFLPYRQQATMGEDIAPFADELQPRRWVLVGHGDWSGGTKYPDPYEPGIYMPLTRGDLEAYQPGTVFLGHIHLPHRAGRVYYPGSPCPLNITETGLRRMLVYDTGKGQVNSHLIDSPLIYFQENFLVHPVEDEISILKKDMESRIQGWGLPQGWEDRVQVRIKVDGYTHNRQAVKDAVLKTFSSFQFYDREGPDLTDLNHGTDPDRARIASQVKSWVEDLSWPDGPEEPSKERIFVEALKAIYGE